MPKRVLNVGHCVPDHLAIAALIRGNFAAEVDAARGTEDAVAALRRQPYDLVLVNRKLDHDYSDGLAVVRAVKADPQLRNTPVMLVTNYPEHQEAAVQVGAEWGFGKADLHREAARNRLEPLLGDSGESSADANASS